MLQPHMQRVLLEKIELDKKLQALSLFLAVSPSKASPEELGLLKRQAAIMLDYSNILGERLAAQPPSVGCKTCRA